MVQKFFSQDTTRHRRHRDAPFADERDRYLQHCVDQGATRATLRVKSNELLWIAWHLDASAPQGVDIETLQDIARARQSAFKGATTARRLIDIARPWLKFLGWWRVPIADLGFQNQLDRYVVWMRDERGFSPSTVEQWQAKTAKFLLWCEQTNRQLSALQPSDIDSYFVSEGTGRWSRVSVANTASALRAFLRYAAAQGECDVRVPEAIRRPRIYEQESLPYAPGWSEVRRILSDPAIGRPHDVRDRAILMLLSIYGMRSGEVASLRLDQIDWRGHVLRLFRLKRRQAQVYPLLPSVAEALALYIDTVRPPAACKEVFIRLQAPWHRLASNSLYDIVNRRFVEFGIQAAHRGPHALRHACATRLLAEGLTLKEIGDHLGHRTTAATRTYAKVDMVSLREVGAFDLGDLQ
jgi:integrase/recombinase XerD